MIWKRLGKSLLFPHAAILILLLPIAAWALTYTMLTMEEASPLRIAAYVLAFYTLAIWCVRMPQIVKKCVGFKRTNRYALRWSGDAHLRIKVTLGGNLIWNGAYMLLQLGLGIYHHSAWFYSLAVYYLSLAVMRLFLMRHTLRHTPGEQRRTELCRYRACGWMFLLTNLALSGMIFYMIYEKRMVRHHEITTIAMAAYTFTTLTVAIVNVIRYRKYNSPVFSAAKTISLAAACVSMLTLESTMLVTFSAEGMTLSTQIIFLALSGAAVSALIIAMAVYMIARSTKQIRAMEA